MLGFTVVFVALGAGAAAIGGVVDAQQRGTRSPASSSSSSASRSSACCRGRSGSSRRGSSARRGGAGRTRSSAPPSPSAPRRASAPCSPRSSCWRATRAPSCAARCCCVAYSLGIGVAFLLAGIAFARAMGAFRWLRDHYTRDPGRERGDARRARPAALLRPGLVAARLLNRALDGGRPRPASRSVAAASRASRRRRRRGGFDLREHGGDVDAAVCRRERGEPAPRLLELARAADRSAAAGLVPGDGDVDEPLVEVALGAPALRARRARAPRAPRSSSSAPHQLQAALELVVAAHERTFWAANHRVTLARGDDPAGGGRSVLPWQARGAPARAPLRDHGHGR